MTELEIAYKFIEINGFEYMSEARTKTIDHSKIPDSFNKRFDNKIPKEMRLVSKIFKKQSSHIGILSRSTTSDFMKDGLKGLFVSITFKGPNRDQLKEQYNAFIIQTKREQQLDKIL